MTATVSPVPTRIIPAPLGALAFHPIICGHCGERPGGAVALRCTDVRCPVRQANDAAAPARGVA